MSTIRVISVCGSGTVSSTMIASHVTDLLEEHGYDVYAVETMPNSLDNVYENGGWDFIITSTTIDEKYKNLLPVFNGLPVLIGIGVEELDEEILQAVSKVAE